MKRFWKTLAVLLCGTSTLYAGQTDSITFTGYPKGARTNCGGTAQTLGAVFAKATNVEIISAKCVRENWLSYDLQIFYSSESSLQLVVSPEWSVYRSKEACDAAISNEEKFFSATTGLTPFFRYCSDFDEGSSWEKTIIHLYTPFFYALGKPKNVLKSLSLEMYQGGYYGGQTLLEEIIEKSLSSGVPIVQAYMDAPKETKNYQSFLRLRFADNPDKPIPSLSREYLLKDRIEQFWALYLPWELDLDPLRFDSVKACESQKKNVESLFSDRFTSPVVWFCMWDHMLFRAHLYHLRIRPGEESFERLTPGEDGEPFANEYATFEDCEKDKPKIATHYRVKLGESLVGAVCSTKLQSKPSLPSKVYVYVER